MFELSLRERSGLFGPCVCLHSQGPISVSVSVPSLYTSTILSSYLYTHYELMVVPFTGVSACLQTPVRFISPWGLYRHVGIHRWHSSWVGVMAEKHLYRRYVAIHCLHCPFVHAKCTASIYVISPSRLPSLSQPTALFHPSVSLLLSALLPNRTLSCSSVH